MDGKASTISDYRAARRRVLRGLLVLVAVLGIGAAGYWYIGWIHDQNWAIEDCIYMTAITVSTVGFTEALDVKEIPGGRAWTLTLILFGISANLYVISSITTFFVEGDFVHLRRYRRIRRAMERVENHYIVCGIGTTGVHVVNELIAVGEAVVAIDADAVRLDALPKSVLPVVGDATEDSVLEDAGLARAKGIVASLDDDKTNMYVVVSARQSNPRLRIVAKAVTTSAGAKLKRAGADAVVSTNRIGGMRMASELLRPQVVKFLDDMLRDRESTIRLEEAVVERNGPLVGQTLAQAALRERTGALVIAIRSTDGTLHHAPTGDAVLTAGNVLIVIGKPQELRELRRLMGTP